MRKWLQARTLRELDGYREEAGIGAKPCGLSKDAYAAWMSRKLPPLSIVHRRAAKSPRGIVRRIYKLCQELKWPVLRNNKGRHRVIAPKSSFVFGLTRGYGGCSFPVRGRVRGKIVHFNDRAVPLCLRPVPVAHALFEALQELVHEHDSDFTYTSIQCNKNFGGALHTDKNNVAPQYAISLGTHKKGGYLAASTDIASEVTLLDTRERLTLTDGRRAHCVTKASGGTRYSFIFYSIRGRNKRVLRNRPPETNARIYH